MAGITITPTVIVESISITDVTSEGQLQRAYFPNCTTQEEFSDFVTERIVDSDDFVQEQVGSTNYNNPEPRVQRQLKKAVLFLTISRLWQIIKNVMDGYDAEALPPEFVQPDQAAANRDYYAEEAGRILMRYEVKPTANNYIGTFDSAGVDDSETSVLGLTY